MDSLTNIDPILEYLLEFNQNHAIEYDDRRLIPAGGLAKMLGDFKGFHLNKVVVIKSELLPPPEKDDLTKLMEMV
jgi:hypothetical protein